MWGRLENTLAVLPGGQRRPWLCFQADVKVQEKICSLEGGAPLQIGKVKVLVVQMCLTLCHPMDYSPPNSSVHGILHEYWSG